MKELEDIILKKSDSVYYEKNDGSIEQIVVTNDNIHQETLFNFLRFISKDCKIIRVVRPVEYKTIYEAPKQILDQKEKEYLEAVIRPFRDRVKYVEKVVCNNDAYISIGVDLNGIDTAMLPYFEKDTMYKGMKPNKEYTLDELGLFKE